MLIDVETDGTLVVHGLEASHAQALVTSILDAAKRIRGVIERLELRALADTLVARILVIPKDEQADRRDQMELVDSLLTHLGPQPTEPALTSA